MVLFPIITCKLCFSAERHESLFSANTTEYFMNRTAEKFTTALSMFYANIANLITKYTLEPKNNEDVI